MTEGDRMLIRAIDRALVAHPFICPLPVHLGPLGGGTVMLSRAAARSLATRLQQMEHDQRIVRARRTALAVVK